MEIQLTTARVGADEHGDKQWEQLVTTKLHVHVNRVFFGSR